MYLKAISIGDAIPSTDFDAVIHSVFKSALNLRFAREDKLLTLVTSSEADLPQGIRVDTPDDFSFEIFRSDEQASCQNGILRIGSLTIELGEARRWKCDLPSLQADLTNPAVLTSWQRAWQILNKRQIQSNAEIIAEDLFRLDDTTRAGVPRKAGEAMRGLLDATRQYNLTDTSSVRALIGLGTGLTPSGDDLLTGYMAGLWCNTKGRADRLNFLSTLGEVVIRLSKGTNDISRNYLYHATRGQVSSRLFNLVSAICTGSDPPHFRDCTNSAMQAGHTSGMDAVTGLLFGLTAWDILA